LYTYSRIRRQQTSDKGSGWSKAGIDKYNEIHEAVKQDRTRRGAAFNAELLKVYMNRRSKQETPPERIGDPKKRKADPTDDLEKDPFEGYGEDANMPGGSVFAA
jgi:hypothetical protein